MTGIRRQPAVLPLAASAASSAMRVMSPRTDAADASNAPCSSAVSSMVMTSSMPDATEPHRHAHVQAIDPELAVEVRGAGQDHVPVVEDGVDHLVHGRGGRVERAAGLEQRHDLGATVAGPVDERLDALRRTAAR